MANTVRTTLRMTEDITPLPQDGSSLRAGTVYYGSYVRVNGKTREGQEAMDDTAIGRFLFEYDPKAYENQRGYRTIWQKSLILGDQWKIEPKGTGTVDSQE